MKKKTSVFLCGDRSPFGFAHLAPLTKHFDVKAIIIADSQRWLTFREHLTGNEANDNSRPKRKFFAEIREEIKKSLGIHERLNHNTKLSSFLAPLITLNDANASESIELIKSFSPEVLFSAAYPQIFCQDLINIGRMGAVNFHPSLLPRCRGAHPHYWCLATGEKQGGVSAHFMTSRIDEGDIIAQRSFGLDGLYYEELYKKIIEITPELVEDVAGFFNNPQARAFPQNASEATTFRNEREIHRKLDFRRMTSWELHNRVRAGRSFAYYLGVRFYVERAYCVSNNRHMTNNLKVSAGTIVDINTKGVVIYTVDDAFIVLSKIKWRSKTESFTKWIEKFGINVGEILE